MAKPRPVPTFDHLAKKKPVEVRDRVVLDQDAAVAYENAREALERERLMHADDPAAPTLVEAQKVHESARDAAVAVTVEVVFRALPRPVYKAMKREFPPTEAQLAEAQELYGVRADVDIDQFMPVLIAASCVQPEMTVDQARSLETEYGWNEAEITHLYQLALRANEARSVINLDFS